MLKFGFQSEGGWMSLKKYNVTLGLLMLGFLGFAGSSFGQDKPEILAEEASRFKFLGTQEMNHGKYKKAVMYFEQALANHLKIYGEEHRYVAIDFNNLGEAWRAQGNYDKAMKYFDRALEISLKIPGQNHLEVADSWNNIAVTLDQQHKNAAALQAYLKARKIYQELGMKFQAMGVQQRLSQLEE